MAEKRMFTKKITDSDAFLNMPLSAQALYFHLNMAADDEGFVNNPQKIQRVIGAAEDDLKLLMAKNFIISFESGVIVIKHWKMHNYIAKDRFHPTDYLDEKKMLEVKENGAYTVSAYNLYTGCIQDDDRDKNSIDKNSIEEYMPEGSGNASEKKTKKKYGEYKHVLLTDEEHEKLKTDFGENTTQSCITFLDEYIEMKGYKAKSHYLCIRKWVVTAVKERKAKEKSVSPKSTFNNIENHTDWNDDFYNSLVDN